MARKLAYTTIKDHKENFNINPKCCLINPAKSELRKVAKSIVENINKTIREKLHCNQWRNTSNVIDWFQNITDKGNCIFIQFDTEEFCPSITKHLLLNAIENAKLYTRITQQELDIILHARKSLLFSKNKPWQETINESLFDITIGSYDSAEICELVDLYILSFLGKVRGIQKVGLYRDDGLAWLHKISGPASDKIRKVMIRTFRENFGLKTVNFLDVTFNPCTAKQQPYKKPNDTPTCINVNSNHPPNISNIYNAAPSYNDVLSASGYKENLTYQQDLTPSKKVRQRKII